MSTRDDIAAAAKASGWIEEQPRRLPWLDTFTREVTLPAASRLQRLANAAGYVLKEQIQVGYTHKGYVQTVTLRTPRDQAAVDGRFVGFSDKAEGTGKKGQVIAWFAVTRNYEEGQ